MHVPISSLFCRRSQKIKRVNSMKNNKIFRFFFAAAASALVFLLFSALYLQNRAANTRVSGVKQNEPYYSGPQNSGVLFRFPDTDCFLYFDFKAEKITAKLTENANTLRVEDMPVNYTVTGDFHLISGIVDRVGGIELQTEEGALRHTGGQVTDLLASFPDDKTLKTDVLRAIFASVSKNGFSKSDFVYIIENSETDLPVVECFYWQDLMAEISRNIEVIP